MDDYRVCLDVFEFARLLEDIRTNSVDEVNDLSEKYLSYNKVSELAKALRGNSSVSSLDLLVCSIDDAAAEALAIGLGSSSVRELWLGCNEIHHMGARALGAALAGSSLEALFLWGNRIGDEGATVLAASCEAYPP